MGFVCIAALLPAPLAWAGVEPEPFRTGLFGVAAGQSVRISVSTPRMTASHRGLVATTLMVYSWSLKRAPRTAAHGDDEGLAGRWGDSLRS